MPERRIPAMSSAEFVKLLRKGGARFIRQRRTSHAIYERVVGSRTFRVPVVMGKRDLTPKYIKLVFHQLGFTNAEIDQLLQ